MIQFIFPWFTLAKANKKVKEKIERIKQDGLDGNIDYMKGFEKLSLSEVKEFFDKTINVKKSLEEKLKTSLFSVTVGLIIMTSTISFLFSDSISSLGSIYKGIIFFTGSVSVIYMIVAGIFATNTISGFIAVYQLFPDDIADVNDDDIKKKVAKCTELNSLSNIIRQNLMCASFYSIITSLSVLTIFFFLIGAGSFVERKQMKESLKVDVNVQPSKDNIDMIKSKILRQETNNKKSFEALQAENEMHNKNISQISRSVEEIKKMVTDNKLEIKMHKDNEVKSSN